MNILVTLKEAIFSSSGLATFFQEKDLKATFLPDTGLDKREAILSCITDVDIVVVGVETIDQEIIDHGLQLKHIIKFGAGIDNIDSKYAKSKGIGVSNAPGQNAESVADLAFGLLLTAARDIPSNVQTVKSGDWHVSLGYEVFGKRLGIIGFGEIGQKVAKRASGFDMDIVSFATYQNEEIANRLGVAFVSLRELLSTSDFVCVCTSLREETYHLLNKESFQIMKESSILINVARGSIINEEDLVEALITGEIQAAGLDVYEVEPPQTIIHTLPNVICTSHIGGATFESSNRIGSATQNTIERLIEEYSNLEMI